MLLFAYLKGVSSPIPRQIPVKCCITSLMPRSNLYGRLLCSHLKKYQNSEELLLWSPDSMAALSGCLASQCARLSKWLCTHPWAQLWIVDFMFPELGFSAVIRDGVYLDMLIARIKTRTFHQFVWTHWEAEASSLSAALRGLWSWLQLACITLE